MLYIFLILTIFELTKSENQLICVEDYCVELTFEEHLLLKNPIYKTYSGHEIAWMDVNDGWTPKRRLEYLEQQRLTKHSRSHLPKYTKNGFKKMLIPEKLYEFIKNSRVERISEIERCGVMRNCLTIKNGEVVNANNSALIGVANINRFQSIVIQKMKDILEDWSNIELSKEAIAYGIRRYFRGAKLWEHTDRVPTHILSAILQVII